jgi:hypothetical protein
MTGQLRTMICRSSEGPGFGNGEGVRRVEGVDFVCDR